MVLIAVVVLSERSPSRHVAAIKTNEFINGMEFKFFTLQRQPLPNKQL